MSTTTIYNQNFESVTPPALPSGWNFDSGITTVAGSLMSGTNCLSVSTTGLKNAFFATLDGKSGNVMASVQVKFTSPGASSSVHMVARLSSPTIANFLTSASSYRIAASCGSAALPWVLVRQVGATATTLATGNVGLQSALVAGEKYELQIIPVGTSTPGTRVNFQVRRLSDGLWLTTTGTWQATETACVGAVDTAAPITGQGYSGFRVDAASGATVNVDEYSVIDYVDNTNYTKLWTDDSGWTPGLVTATPSVFGSEAAAVFASDNVLRSFNSGFTDRRWNGALTWTCQFKLSVMAVSTSCTLTFKAHGYDFQMDLGLGTIKLRDSATTTLATVAYTAANWTASRPYRMAIYCSPTVAEFRIRDSVTGFWLQSTGAFSATDAWAATVTPVVVPNPSQSITIQHQSATSVASIGTITAGPAGTPSASPNPATVNLGASTAITPTMFPGVFVTGTPDVGSYNSTTGIYTAPGSGSSASLTIAATFVPTTTVTVPITLTAASATTYALTGPSSGGVGSASTDFTITPDGVYTGTITITPSGGGLSTPIVKTFSASGAPQAFTITPTSAGTVTLTPTNNGSLTNPSNLTYTANAALSVAYVAASGSDSNAGTIGSPFLTIAAAISGTTAGAVINLRGGDTFSAAILLNAATGGRTILSYGTGQAIISVAGGCITVTNIDTVTLSNLKIVNTLTTATAVFLNCTDSTRRSGGITITGCDISGGSIPIRFRGLTATTGGWNNITITNNTIHDATAIGIYLDDSAGGTAYHYSQVVVDDNIVHTITGANNGAGSGITMGHCDSVTGTGAGRSFCRRNHVYNIATDASANQGGGGIQTVYSDDVWVESNLIHDIHSSSAQTDGTPLDYDFSSSNCVFQFNYCYNSGGAGILCFGALDGNIVRWNVFANCGQSGYPGLAGLRLFGVGGATIHNNVFHNDPSSTVAALFGFNGGSTTNKKIYNNIFVSASGVPTVDLPTAQASFALAGNAYQMGDGSSVALKYNGTTSTSLAAFRTATGRETGTGFTTTLPFVGFADPIPEITDPADIPSLIGFMVPGASPLAGAGLNLQTAFSINPGPLDFAGATVAAPYSVGAFDAASVNATGYALGASPGSVATGQAATITATITGGTALLEPLVITVVDSLASTISGTITISNGSTTGTATVTPTVGGTHAITATHTGGGFTGGDGSTLITATAIATSFTLTGPGTGTVGTASTNFTITPNASFTGTFTPTATGLSGTFSPTSLTFSGSTSPQAFTFTPSASGAGTINVTSSGSLTSSSGPVSFVASAASPITTAYTLVLPPSATALGTYGVGVLFDWPLAQQTTVTLVDGQGTFPGGTHVVVGVGDTFGSAPWVPTIQGTHTFGVSHAGQSGITDPTTGLAITVAAASGGGGGGGSAVDYETGTVLSGPQPPSLTAFCAAGLIGASEDYSGMSVLFQSPGKPNIRRGIATHLFLGGVHYFYLSTIGYKPLSSPPTPGDTFKVV